LLNESSATKGDSKSDKLTKTTNETSPKQIPQLKKKMTSTSGKCLKMTLMTISNSLTASQTKTEPLLSPKSNFSTQIAKKRKKRLQLS
jgi:hypothetical protein